MKTVKDKYLVVGADFAGYPQKPDLQNLNAVFQGFGQTWQKCGKNLQFADQKGAQYQHDSAAQTEGQADPDAGTDRSRQTEPSGQDPDNRFRSQCQSGSEQKRGEQGQQQFHSEPCQQKGEKQ